jgi:hypothetical protein
LDPFHSVKVPIPDDVPIDSDSRSGVSVAQLSLSNDRAGRIYKHTRQPMTESMEANPPAVSRYSELVEHRVKHFLNDLVMAAGPSSTIDEKQSVFVTG